MDTAVKCCPFFIKNNYYFRKKLQKNLVIKNKNAIFVSRNKFNNKIKQT